MKERKEYMDEYRRNHREKLIRYSREYRARNRGKMTARRLLNLAILRGEITRPETCSRCGSPGDIEGHHPDHSKPYDVIWLCFPCRRSI
jgi:hypothetical protein